jgi:hypothetical protein
MKISLDKVLRCIYGSIRRHTLEKPGEYARFTGDAIANPYGCADAANLLYVLDDFPRDEALRRGFVTALRSMQVPETGLFQEKTHHPFHVTAHCIAALELFDAAPLYDVKALTIYREKTALEDFLGSLEWESNPWSTSHQGAGLYAVYANMRLADAVWKKYYFDWLQSHCDPETGIGFAGAMRKNLVSEAEHLFGWFHYLFCFTHAHRAIPYPERLIDSCLRLYDERKLGSDFLHEASFRQIDWVFALNRARRETPYRFQDIHDRLLDFAARFVRNLENDSEDSSIFNDLHTVFGMTCALAELELALPEEIESEIPLRNVLDRRPFI